MSRFKHNLDQVRVAAPCNVDWDAMFGNERVRFCGQCELNVYNLSEMTRPEAERLIAQTEGRLCVRYYQRKDGSVITRNCPVGLAAIKRRFSRVATAVGSIVLSFFAGGGVVELTNRLSEAKDVVVNALETSETIPPVSLEVIADSYPPEHGVLAMGRLVRIEPPKVERQRLQR